MKLYKDNDNNIYAYEEDGLQDHLINDKISITQTEANAIQKEKEAQYSASLDYKQKRLAEYPTWNEQLDNIYHNGIDAWKADIKAIKDKYPKGEAK